MNHPSVYPTTDAHPHGATRTYLLCSKDSQTFDQGFAIALTPRSAVRDQVIAVARLHLPAHGTHSDQLIGRCDATNCPKPLKDSVHSVDPLWI